VSAKTRLHVAILRETCVYPTIRPRPLNECFAPEVNNLAGAAWITRDKPRRIYHFCKAMPEIQHYLPAHTQPHFIRLRISKWEAARAAHNEKLLAVRRGTPAINAMRSGHLQLAEWNLSQEFAGNMAMGYLEAALETCALYNIRLDERLCTGIKSAIKEFLMAQRKNALLHDAQRLPGAVHVPISVRQQLSGDRNLPRFNEVLIELEKARVEGTGDAARKEPQVSQVFNVHGPNARVNIDSTDNSTNVVHQGVPFSELRKAIESGVSEVVERATILERLSDLEEVTDRESGAERYQKFIAAAANHMTLIGPYLPALGHWVHSLLAAAT
jgi:hypothetical protein